MVSTQDGSLQVSRIASAWNAHPEPSPSAAAHPGCDFTDFVTGRALTLIERPAADVYGLLLKGGAKEVRLPVDNTGTVTASAVVCTWSESTGSQCTVTP